MTKEEYLESLRELRILNKELIRYSANIIDLSIWMLHIRCVYRVGCFAYNVYNYASQNQIDDLNDIIRLHAIIPHIRVFYARGKKLLYAIEHQCIPLSPDYGIENDEDDDPFPHKFDERWNAMMDSFMESINGIYDDQINKIQVVKNEINSSIIKTNKTLHHFLPIVKESVYKIYQLNDFLMKCDDVDSSLIIDAYFYYLRKNEQSILDELTNSVYEFCNLNYSEEAQSSDWADLLKKYLTVEKKTSVNDAEIDGTLEDDEKTFYASIRTFFYHNRALSIYDDNVIEYIHELIKERADFILFFECFVTIAILQEKAKPNIKMIREPKTDEPVEPLHEIVRREIRENDELNRLFREEINRVAIKVKQKVFYWHHVREALKDDGLFNTSEINDKNFGEMIQLICPKLNADTVRRKVAGDENPKRPQDCINYSELQDTDKYRIKLETISKEFAELKRRLGIEHSIEI